MQRPRRLRSSALLRDLVAESHLNIEQLVYPLFVVDGKNIRKEIPSMPGCFHLSVDSLANELNDCKAHGIGSVLLFGIPDKKDEFGSVAYDPDGVVQRAIRTIKDVSKETFVIADVCMCEYTDHGHCGILVDREVDNDRTLEYLGRIALAQAKAGVDMVAPSDMMDGRVGAIRMALDENGFTNLPIMAYSAKFASYFYGPFREAAHSTPSFGDRRSYQMDVRNGREAIKEILLDLSEGADIVMVKPGLAFLDVVKEARSLIDCPLAVYNVSGEYSLIKKGIEAGLVDERIILEVLLSIRRAGADIIITYFAKDYARLTRG